MIHQQWALFINFLYPYEKLDGILPCTFPLLIAIRILQLLTTHRNVAIRFHIDQVHNLIINSSKNHSLLSIPRISCTIINLCLDYKSRLLLFSSFLQAAEAYLVHLFEDAMLCAIHAKRVTLSKSRLMCGICYVIIIYAYL